MRTQPEDTNMQRPQTTANVHLVTHIHLISSLKSRENDCSCNWEFSKTKIDEFFNDFLLIFFLRKNTTILQTTETPGVK